jgi:hypothetical protein
LRKPFRKQKISDKWKEDILFAIKQNLKENKPLNITLLFWGYKHFWSSSSPDIDWAELFFIDHIIEWLKPILSIYTPWIVFTFASEDIILDVMNWYDKKDLDSYSKSFLILLDNLKQYFPENFNIEYIRMGQDIYDWEKMKKEVLNWIDDKILEFKKKDIEYQEKYLYRCERNLTFSNITIDDKIKSKMIEDSFYEVEEKYSGDFFSEAKIYVTLTWWRSKEENIFEWLSIWSTRSTLVDFWIWKWIIEQNETRNIKKIVSQNQYLGIEKIIKTENIEWNFTKLGVFDEIETYTIKR